MCFNKFLSIVFLISVFFSCSAIKDLMQDMGYYKSEDHFVHSGDVYEHSIWVLRTAAGWLKNNEHPWTDGIDIKKYKKALVLTAFLHDIGKCGDNVFDWSGKAGHPETGFEYLTGKKAYKSDKVFILNNLDFKKIGEEFGLTANEFKLVAILIRMHHKFGDLMSNHMEKKYIDFLKETSDLFNYPINVELLRMCILISAADVKGQLPQQYGLDMFEEIPFYDDWISSIKPTHPAEKNGWTMWKYGTVGVQARAAILGYYNKHKIEYEKDNDKFIFSEKLSDLSEKLGLLKMKLRLLLGRLKSLQASFLAIHPAQ